VLSKRDVITIIQGRVRDWPGDHQTKTQTSQWIKYPCSHLVLSRQSPKTTLLDEIIKTQWRL